MIWMICFKKLPYVNDDEFFDIQSGSDICSQESSFIGDEIDEVDCGSNTDLRETNRLMANEIDEVDCWSDLDLRETDRLMAEEVDCGSDIDLTETNCLVNDVQLCYI